MMRSPRLELPSVNPCSLFVPIALSLLALMMPGSWLPGADGPLPELRKQLDESQYRERRQKALAAIDRKQLMHSTYPLTGICLRLILPDSQAARLGIEDGDVLVSIDGKVPADVWDFPFKRTLAAPIAWWSPTTGVHNGTAQPGPIGMTLQADWVPELLYMHQPSHSPQWDDDMLAASLTWESDPIFSETALAMAHDKGFAGSLLWIQAASIALEQGRFADSLAFGQSILDKAHGVERMHAAHNVYTAACALGHYDVAAGLYGDMGLLSHGLDDKKIAELRLAVSNAQSAPEKPWSDPSPMALAMAMPGHDLGTTWKSMNGGNGGDYAVERLGAVGRIPFSLAVGKWQTYRLGPPARNLAMAVTASYHSTGAARTPEEARIPAAMAIGLVDESVEPAAVAIAITFRAHGELTISANGFPDYIYHPAALMPGADSANRIEITTVNGAFEAHLNDAVLARGLFGSDPRKRTLSLYLQAVGITGTFTDIHRIALGDEAGDASGAGK